MSQHSKYLLIIYILCLFVPVQGQDKEADRWMKRGKEAYADGDFDRAITYYEELAKINAYYDDLFLYRGNAFYRLGELREAELDYLEAIKVLPKPESNSSRRVKDSFILLDPSGDEDLNKRYALLYNNLGVTRFRQGKKTAAMKAFELALEYNPDLEIADKNDRYAYSNRGKNLAIQEELTVPNRRLRGEDDNSRYTRKRKSSYENDSNRRPVSSWERDDRDSYSMMLDVREAREDAVSKADLQSEKKKETVFDRLLKPKVFIKRKVGKRGKTYKRPDFLGTTQSYLSIERVFITNKSTYVTIRVENKDSKSYWVSLSPKSSSEAYKIIARGDNRHKEYDLKAVTGMAEYPRTTELRANDVSFYVLEFERIPDNVGIINIIEGENQRNSAWNFYQVDLRK